jgi:hypothetical protein
MVDLEQYLTLEQVADLLQLPPASLYQQRHRGVAPGSLGIRCGRYLRWDPRRLRKWLDGQQVRDGGDG